jgi:HEAT repeat protein
MKYVAPLLLVASLAVGGPLLAADSAPPAASGNGSSASAPKDPAPPDYEDRLSAYLRAGSPAEAEAALNALKQGGPVGSYLLMNRLRQEMKKEDPDEAVVAKLESALEGYGKAALPDVVNLMRNPKEDPLLRAEAARVLAREQGQKSVFALVEVAAGALQANPSPLGARMIEVLGDLSDNRPYPMIERALRHADPSVRFAAAIALGKLGDTTAVSPLLQALNDSDRAVRSAAYRSLVKLTRVDPGLSPEEAASDPGKAADRWNRWRLDHGAAVQAVSSPSARLWDYADDLLAWAMGAKSIPNLGAPPFPPSSAASGATTLVSNANLPDGLLPVVPGQKIVVHPPAELSPVPAEGYWRFGEPKARGDFGALALTRVTPEGARSATVRFAREGDGWKFDSVQTSDSAALSSNPSPPASRDRGAAATATSNR